MTINLVHTIPHKCTKYTSTLNSLLIIDIMGVAQTFNNPTFNSPYRNKITKNEFKFLLAVNKRLIKQR